MEFEGKYNPNSPAVKRLMREASELKTCTEEYYAHPLEENLFEWHFTVQGPPATEFEGGVYHGRILLPTEYPMKPPNIILLTPNGRFETNKKICLSISGHHPETWQPSWSIRTALLALIAFMPTPSTGTIGSLDYTKEERQILAKKSQNWECPQCGKIILQLSLSSISKPVTAEESNLIKRIALKAEETDQSADNQTDEKTDILEDGIRQRLIGTDETISSSVVEGNGQTTVVNSWKIQNWLIGFIVVAISVLIFRRLFLI